MMGHKHKGFSLIELMVVLMILSVVLVAGLPSYAAVRLNNDLRNFANDLVTAVVFARSESIKRNAEITFCASADGATCVASGDWEQGWVILDPDDNVLQTGSALDSGYRLVAEELGSATVITEIVFDPSGVISPAADFVLCRQSPASEQEREITLTPSGRTAVDTTYDKDCPA